MNSIPMNSIPMNFILKKLEQITSADIDAIVALIQTVYEKMPDSQKEWFVVDNAAYTRSLLETEKGWAYIALDEKTQELAGVFLTVFPGNTSENLGHDIGLCSDALPLVAHMDSAVTAPAFRGHHLQARLMQLAEKDIQAAGFRYLCCTVHPDNHYSMNSVLSLGYKKATICEKYGGHLRAILVKEICL